MRTTKPTTREERDAERARPAYCPPDDMVERLLDDADEAERLTAERERLRGMAADVREELGASVVEGEALDALLTALGAS